MDDVPSEFQKPLKLSDLHHGMSLLQGVRIDCYNSMLRDGDGFLGDRANKGAFQERIREWRAIFGRASEDPLSALPTEGPIPKSELDVLLLTGNFKERAVIHSAIDDFAGAFVSVVQSFLELKEWSGTERIVVGGGFIDSVIGKLAIGRAQAILFSRGPAPDLRIISNHPDEAGLVGAAYMLPAEMLKEFNAFLAIDIGGTNVRCGIVKYKLYKDGSVEKTKARSVNLWRHGDEDVSRNDIVARITLSLLELEKRAAKSRLRLAPFVCAGCPGLIGPDGSIRSGTQNLPGNWDGDEFHLGEALEAEVPQIAGNKTEVIIHNDAVIQGLSERPAMRDCRNWAVLTIGTGLGNAHFSNLQVEPPSA
ncbi:ROK family protein [Hyphomicrobium sp. 99]|uniref:ROK family protein n=1 Tax=Hyphomicrobium sp. 99 TaxID=1163419 RepID=UPI0005F7F3FB|nr:ROK family protein [Hyphomicrobium sp. 99]